MIDESAAQPAAPVSQAEPVAKLYLWRVWNLGYPDGHEDSTNEWGDYNIINALDALRLSNDDDKGRYQFVPLTPTQPNTVEPVAKPVQPKETK